MEMKARMPQIIIIPQGVLFSVGGNPAFGSAGMGLAATTVAVAESRATIPLASPVATAVFVVVESILAWQR